MTMHSDILRMHGMFANCTALHGTERSGTNMQSDFFAFNTMRINLVQYPFRKMQSCCRRRHRTLNLGIDRLIGRLVALLCLAVQVRRNGQFTQHIENVGKIDVGIVPLELNELTGSLLALTNCRYLKLFVFYFKVPNECSFLPFFLIAYQTQPRTAMRLLEHLFIVSRYRRLQQENFDQCTCVLAEVQTSLNNLCIVHNHQGSLRQVFGQVIEYVLLHYTFII